MCIFKVKVFNRGYNFGKNSTYIRNTMISIVLFHKYTVVYSHQPVLWIRGHHIGNLVYVLVAESFANFIHIFPLSLRLHWNRIRSNPTQSNSPTSRKKTNHVAILIRSVRFRLIRLFRLVKFIIIYNNIYLYYLYRNALSTYYRSEHWITFCVMSIFLRTFIDNNFIKTRER